MSNSQLKQTFTTDESKLLAAYEKLLRKQQDVLDSTIHLAKASTNQSQSAQGAIQAQADGAQQLAGGLSQGVGQLGKMALGYVGLTSAAQAFTQALEKQFAQQEKAADAQRRFANPSISLRQNMGDIPAAKFKQIEDRIEQMSMQGLGSAASLKETMAATVSATPNLTHDQQLDIVKTAARASKSGAEELQSLAQGLGDAVQLTGSTNAEENLGFMLSLQQKSPSKNLKPIAENIVPGAANIVSASGGTPAEAAAILLGLQQRMIDREGAITKTAGISGVGQLDAFFDPQAVRARTIAELTKEGTLSDFERPDLALRKRFGGFMEGEGVGDRGFEDQLEAFRQSPELQEKYFAREVARMGASTPAEQIRFMQQNPREREKFSENLHLEKQAQQPFLELLDANSKTAKNVAELSKQGLVSGPAAAALGGKVIADVESDRYVQQDRTAAGLEASADRLRRESESMGDAGISRKALVDVLDASGMDDFKGKLTRLDFEFKTNLGEHGVFDQLDAAFAARADELRHKKTAPEALGLGRLLPESMRLPQDDPEMLRQAEIIDQTRAQLQAARRQAEARRNAPQQAPPAPPAPPLDQSPLPLDEEAARQAAERRRAEMPRALVYGDVEKARQLLAQNGGLPAKFTDELDLLSTAGKTPEDLIGHSGDLSELYDVVSKARERQLHPGALDEQGNFVRDDQRPPTAQEQQAGAVLEEIRDAIKLLHEATVKAEQAQQTANRQAGARASRASGKE